VHSPRYTAIAERSGGERLQRPDLKTKYLRLGLDVLTTELGVSADAAERHSSAILFPECIISRRAEAAISHLRERGFRPVWARPIDLDIELICDLRRFGPHRHGALPAATRAILEMMETAGKSLYVLLRYEGHDRSDTSTYLSQLKGLAFPEERHEQHLRTVLGSKNPVFKMLHTPDDNQVFIGELGIIAAHRPGFFRGVGRTVHDPAAAIRSLYAQTVAHDLDFAAALRRLNAIVDRADLPPAQSARLRRFLEEAKKAVPFDWTKLFRPVERCELQIPLWDRITICGHLTKYDWRPDIETALRAQSMRGAARGMSVGDVYRLLRRSGYAGSYAAVKSYIAKRKQREGTV
jgi:hypothetical protein